MVDFKEVADYFKNEILCYNDEQKLDKYTIMRLKGLSTGQYIMSYKQEIKAKYSWEAILLTMKLKRADINKYTHNKTFKDEKHKINTIMVIIDNGLNESVRLLEKKKKSSQKAEVFEMKHIESEVADYTRKSAGINKKLVDIL